LSILTVVVFADGDCSFGRFTEVKIDTALLKRCSRWIEFGYAVLLIAALTQGPILSLWNRADQGSLGYQVDVAVFCTYFLVQLPAIALLGRRISLSKNMLGPIGVLFLLLAWLLASTGWSTYRSQTMIQISALVATCCAGIYFAKSFKFRQQIAIVAVAMQPGLIASWWAVTRSWKGADTARVYWIATCKTSSYVTAQDCQVRERGNWIGIYFNKNSLAPVAVVGMFTLLLLIWFVVSKRSGKWWPAIAFLLVDVLILNYAVFDRTDSATALVAAFGGIGVWLFWSVARYISRRTPEWSKTIRNAVFAIFSGIMALGVWVLNHYEAYIASQFGKQPGFDGRDIYWAAAWDAVKTRPWIGWGWMSAWFTGSFRDGLTDSLQYDYFSHNGYLDILLGGGLVAGVLFSLWVLWSGERAIKTSLKAEGGQWTFSMAVLVLIAASQESIFVGGNFLLLLLVAALSGPIFVMAEPDDS